MKKKTEAAVEAAKQAAVESEMTRGGVKGNGWLMKRGKWWIACWKYNGKLHKKTTKETNEAKAREKLRLFVAPYMAKRLDRDVDAVALAVSSGEEHKRRVLKGLPALKVADAFAVFEKLDAASYLAPYTRKERGLLLARVASWCDGRREDGLKSEMRSITATDAREFVEAMKTRGVSLQTIAKDISHLKSTWTAIAEAEAELSADGKALDKLVAGFDLARLSVNPWAVIAKDYSQKAIRAKGATKQKRQAFTADEIRRIVGSADGEFKTLFQIGALTGLRLGDAACLKWGENVQLDKGETGRLAIKPKKTSRSSGAVVERALGRELHDILAALPGAKDGGAFILPECAALYLKEPTLLSEKVQTRLRRAGIETQAKGENGRARTLRGFHSFRYSFVSFRANGGEDIDAIRADVGHSSATMTETYHQRDDAAMEREAAATDGLFSGSRKASKTVSRRAAVAAGEVGRADVADAQKPVFDAVCAMLGNLEPDTLRAVASEALRLAMHGLAKASAVGDVAAAS